MEQFRISQVDALDQVVEMAVFDKYEDAITFWNMTVATMPKGHRVTEAHQDGDEWVVMAEWP